MFDTVLIANRGEIAVRITRTLRALGIRAVAVYSDADAGARHVREADDAIRLGPAPAAQSYLNAGRILAAARRAGAQAIHPGYGFLSENAAFARACADAGLVFIGPPAAAIEAMGDKIAAKATVAAAGVPVVPGAGAPGMSDDDLAAAAAGIGFPLLIKPSAGGGGKGMRLVASADELPGALQGARREALAAFGDETLLAERYISRPRHIEIQVLADTHGAIIHLGERECSLQRRHQKIIEEAPSPLLDRARRAAMGAAAVEAARSVGYAGAGTVEFIVSGDAPEDFWFLEMNTRLQVEHPVTELVTGLDLVELQVRVAAGAPLPIGQDEVPLAGHAVEARVYAEDPDRGFLPTGGTVLALAEPARPHVRVDSGLAEGMTVGSAYDPMLAKVIAHGPDRATALRRLDAALADMTVLGVTTNVGYLRALLSHPDVVAGQLDTGLAERAVPAPAAPGVPGDVLAAAALARLLLLEPGGERYSPWDVPDGWRVGEPAWTTVRLASGAGDPVPVRIRGRARAAEVSVGGAEPVAAHAEFDAGALVVTCDGRTWRYAYAHTGTASGGGTAWLGRDGHAWALAEEEPLAAGPAHAAGGDGVVRSPMPGTVRAVKAARGDRVRSGQPLLIVEAMKMEHTVSAPADGVVAELAAAAGQQVALDETLAVITPDGEAG
ncbi:MAG: ATP-grasp domain-containing protein [Actinobacteria bacterium]|nr:ATP-grasp domain-containing protein [Actinomycetota bacterium]